MTLRILAVLTLVAASTACSTTPEKVETTAPVVVVVPAPIAVPGTPMMGEAAFQKEWANAWCARQAQCDTKAAAEWPDRATCVSRKSDQAQFMGDWKEMVCGAYSPERVDSCLSEMNGAQCDDWLGREWKNECGRVYGC